MNNILSEMGLGGLLGSNTSAHPLQNAQQKSPLPGSVWVTTTGNTTAAQQLSGIHANGAQQAVPSNYVLMQETHKALEQVRNDLLPLKKWLIATYPDIYQQYVAVEEIRKASNAGD